MTSPSREDGHRPALDDEVDGNRRFRVVVAAVVLTTLMATGLALINRPPVGGTSVAVVGVRARGCGPQTTANGFLLDDGRVATVAHAVAGRHTVEVVVDDRRVRATVDAIDSSDDVAILSVEWNDGVPVGQNLGNVTMIATTDRLVPATVVRSADIRGPLTDSAGDDGPTESRRARAGFELRASIVDGDSGAPLLVDGSVAGMVFARSDRDADRAWAVDVSVVHDVASVDHGGQRQNACPEPLQ